MKEQTGTTDQLEDQRKESTYALLIRSEKGPQRHRDGNLSDLDSSARSSPSGTSRGKPVNIPPAGLDPGGCVACVDDLRAVRQVRHPEIKG